MKLSLWPLTLIIYTNWFLKDWQWGCFFGLIFIRPEHRDDPGIEAHELTHAAQFWEFLVLGFMILYTFHRRSRFAFEAAAYRAQLKYHPDHKAVYANILTSQYNLNITTDEALAALT